MMFEDKYKKMNSRINAPEVLVEGTLERAASISTPIHKKRKHSLLRPVVAAVVFLLCVGVSVPVLAAYVPAVYELMYLVSPEIAQHFVPVQESCEDNGVRMEVVSACIHDNKAEVYVTMQDLTGDRIDETTDLFDSYEIHRDFSSSSTCRFAGYNAQTRTVTFLITVEEWGDHEIDGAKLTFSVREFISRKSSVEDTAVDISLSSAEDAAKTKRVYLTGCSGLNASALCDEALALMPQGTICSPLRGLDVTAVGYVDGKLHVQLSTIEKRKLDPHGYFYLVGGNGERHMYDYSISFTDETDSGQRTDYQEFVFDMTRDEAEKCKLYGSFYTAGMNTAGDWRITFPLNKEEE